MRVLVTGSRDWQAERRVWEELDMLLVDTAATQEDLVVVHGDCPKGVDRMARNWVERRRDVYAVTRVSQERHPARWSEFGKPAGFRRNAEMVGVGADVCLAFIRPCSKINCHYSEPHGSHGASNTADLAMRAGIKVREFREGW